MCWQRQASCTVFLVIKLLLGAFPNTGAAAPKIGGIYGVADMQGIGTMEQKQLRLCQCLQLITPIWIMEALRDKTQGAAA